MTTNDKQPTGWVAVDFHDPQRTFWGMNGWTDYSGVVPFSSKDGARNGVSRVFPWPVPQAVIAMLQYDHPTVDWSQVPVADAQVEKPGRWVIQDPTGGRAPYHDRVGWQESAGECSQPWATKVDAEAFMRLVDWSLDRFSIVNLDDLPSPAVAEPSEVERLRARVGWLDMLDTEEGRRTFADEKLRVEVEELRGALIECVKACGGVATERVSTEFLMGTPNEVRLCVEKLTRERDDARASVASVSKQLRREADEAIRERDEARAELAKVQRRESEGVAIFDQLLAAERATVQSLRAAQEKMANPLLTATTLSRLDEFAKAALSGMLADPERDGAIEDFAADAVEYAQATIRAIDGAGGA